MADFIDHSDETSSAAYRWDFSITGACSAQTPVKIKPSVDGTHKLCNEVCAPSSRPDMWHSVTVKNSFEKLSARTRSTFRFMAVLSLWRCDRVPELIWTTTYRAMHHRNMCVTT